VTQLDPVEGNPYRSPAGDVVVAAEISSRPRFRVLAVVVGAVVDIVAMFVVVFAIAIVFTLTHMAPGLSTERLQRMWLESTSNQIGAFAAGLLCTALGGYVAAWMGRGLPLRHALAVGIIGVLWGVAGCVLSPESMPAVWINATGFVVTVPAALFGGWLRAQRDKGKTSRNARGQ
jgi:hypothetical protein